MALSSIVTAARKKKGLTQEELADRTRITVRTIQRIESGDTTPRSYTLKAIATALDIPFEELVTAGNPQPPPPVAAIPSAPAAASDSISFLQLLCLSCFSYLVIPLVHFLLPLYLLRKRKEQQPVILAYAQRVVKGQLYWVVALTATLLLTVAYNLFCAAYLYSSYRISYLVPFFMLYLVNGLLIIAALRGTWKVNVLHLPST